MTGSPATYSLRELSERFGGEIVGDPELRVSRVGTLETAGADAIAFLANERYLRHMEATRAAAVIVGEAARDATKAARIVCANPYAYFARVSALFNPPPAVQPGVHPTAVVHESAAIDPGAQVGAYAVIGRDSVVGEGTVVGAGAYLGERVRIGRGSRLHPHVTVYDGCVIGERTIVHSGVVIGADGFGIALEEERWIKVPQIGGVRIGDDVEIGANTTVDRGALDDTVIEEGVKLDNQVQVGHNVRIGAHSAVAGCVGIAGSARIGRHVTIGGAAMIHGHIEIVDHVHVSAGTLISRSLLKPGTYTGIYPFDEHEAWRRSAARLRRLAKEKKNA